MQSLKQHFQVPYSYEVFFTERLFAAENRVFADFIQNYGNPTFRKKILFVIDKGVTDIQTKLTAEIVAYFQTHSTADLAPEILVLPGGEVCKNDPRFYEEVIAIRLWRALVVVPS
jgi:3-dehydroquinate synthase